MSAHSYDANVTQATDDLRMRIAVRAQIQRVLMHRRFGWITRDSYLPRHASAK